MQRDVFSEQALTELLESILKSDSMSERDKLKWIKQASAIVVLTMIIKLIIV